VEKSDAGEAYRTYSCFGARSSMEGQVGMSLVRIAFGISGALVPGAVRRALTYCGLRVERLFLKELAVCGFAVGLLALPLTAQSDSSAGGSTPGWPLHNSAPTHGTPDAVGAPIANVEEREESCLLWTVGEVRSPTVNAAALQIPGKARGEYNKGCSDLRGKKLATAESHLRKAVEDYPRYAAAWVLLGEVLEAGKRMEEARGACSRASGVDPEYAPAYLCLADVSGQLQEWNQALDQADRALKLGPTQNVYGNFYCALAHFHLSHLPAAEKNALETIDADHHHRVPQAHLLLAQIYGAKHDYDAAAVQLREYLKIVPNSPDAAAVKKRLADLESQTAK
jgi:tetratricopeptide (TPR) repeat protein